MKKLTAILLLMAMMLSLCACGNDGKPAETTAAGKDPTNAPATTVATTPSGTNAPTTGTVLTTTAPAVTTPPTTAPVATTPPTTAPVATTAPVVTTPPTTAPVVTTPPTTAPVATSCSHNWTAATCQAPKTCTKCGATEGGLAAHTEVAVPGKAATCNATGLTEGKKCSVCGTVTVAQQTVATVAHTEVDVPAVETSCKAPGLTAGRKCSVCGTFTVVQQTVPALEHTYGEWYLGQEAACNSYGYNVRTCSVCYQEDRDDIPPTGVHNYVNGKCACGDEIKGTDGLSYELSSDGTYYICKGYTKYSLPSKIVIPSYYNGKPVKECIGNGVVDLFDTVKEIEISEGIEVIGKMFFYCNGATTITIPSSVRRIHGSGIDCKNLQTAYVKSSGWTLNGKAVDLSNPTAAAQQFRKYNDGKWYTR